MDFSFSPDQLAIRETAERFATEQLSAGYTDREGVDSIDREVIREMGKIGLIAPEIPETFGGLGVDSVTAGLVIEAISFADINVGYVPLLTGLVGTILAKHAKSDLAKSVVASACNGNTLLALALTEPGSGSDAANLRLKATRTNDGYILSGEKTSISLATQADEILVMARTGNQDSGARGITAFLVSGESQGIKRSSFNDLGSRIVGRGSIFFDDVKVEDGRRVGEEGAGFRQVMGGFDYSRALIGLQVLAAASASLSECWDFTKERQTFGKPIASYQGVTFPLAEAETLVEAARLLCYKTLWLRDNNNSHTKEAAMVKWWAPKVAFDAIHQCLLTFGHSGYSLDMPHQQRLRDVLGFQIGDGTAQVQQLVIARELVGRIALDR